MKSIITFAGLAFASFAAAGPCRPRTTTTAAAVSSSTEIASSTATETAAVSTSTDYSVPVVSESSTLATVIVSETSATETSAAETSTVGTTTAETSAADQSCDNAGLEYAIYEHTFYNSDPPYFSSFDPTFFHTATPTFQGETTRIGIPPGTASDTSFAIYAGSPVQRFQYKAVNHQAFLYAPDTGDYKVTIPNSDEITLIWFGTKAISGWTRQNADLEQDYPGGTSKSFTIHLTAGTYTPFRLLWANAQGDLNFIAEVQAPDGTVIVNGDGSNNRYFVRFACDESTPSFPAFGGSG
ncbi:hypothetical protein FOTG_15984 [Fusarium oxysporum f. sp. vasinfectum 25433]|uniref:PA14 domain-containing protein n=1 Tax=Fusarium oxysporum f. sp. vasinfectum 25433 TaxID=1089449 RepID=X0L3P0_FUSOX|nr:hypothetical protein FOTG_15984 [Fusarium oxysporum f. sp. vasinfectum 25433]